MGEWFQLPSVSRRSGRGAVRQGSATGGVPASPTKKRARSISLHAQRQTSRKRRTSKRGTRECEKDRPDIKQACTPSSHVTTDAHAPAAHATRRSHMPAGVSKGEIVRAR